MSELNWTDKDLGAIDAYAFAVENGYFSGTREQWYAMISGTTQNASDAEAYAKGTRAGEAVTSDDPAYHNNSSYWNDQAGDNAENAEAWANGTRDGVDVTSGDPAYEKNSKYWEGQAALQKAAAQAAAETASAAYNVNLLAPNYDATSTYAVGAHVIYSGGYYECISAITTAEAWTAAHWRQLTVGGEAGSLKSAIDDMTENENPDYNNIIDWDAIKNETLMWNAGTYQENSGYWSTDYTPIKPNKTYIRYNPVTGNYPSLGKSHLFDINKNALPSVSWSDNKLTTPANAAFIVISKRYVHGGSLGEYNPTEDWDDDIGKMVINIADNGEYHSPYPDYLTEKIKVRHEVSNENRVVRINDAVSDDSSYIVINRSNFTVGSNIDIVITKRNIFDRVLQAGYWNGSSVAASSTHKASVNPIYINGGEWIVTNKNCRITEFLSDGSYNTSYLATARQPYKTASNTNYLHISAENANMESMCIYAGKKIPDVDVAYASKTISHTVRNWGVTNYKVPVKLYDGYNSVYVKINNSPLISVGYNADINVNHANINKNTADISDNNGFECTKMAGSTNFTAHRGSTIEAPENTTYAIVKAFQNGFKNVEIDVRFTLDDVPVLLHDSTIDRTSNGTGSVSSFTYEQLQSYDFGSWMGSKYRDTKIPSLDIVCRLCRMLNIRPHLDIAGNTAITETQVNIICEVLKKYDLLDGCVWYLRTTNSGNNYIKAFYRAENSKYYAYWQATGFGETSIVSLLNNINNNMRDDSVMYDMGISINISDLTTAIKNTALGFTRRVPIAIYFVDSYNDFQLVQDYPYELYCTNREDIPLLAAQYFAPGSVL